MRRKAHVPFGKGLTEKDPNHGHLAGGLLHSAGGRAEKDPAPLGTSPRGPPCPGRQGPGRTPGPTVDLLAPLDAAGDDRARPAGRTRRERAHRPTRPGHLIELTCAEIRRLFITLIVEPARALVCPLHWSNWRRRHQHRARTSHYQRQQASERWP